MSKLNERAMLAVLHCGVWSGSSHDQEVSDEVAKKHKAEAADAGRYSKQLIAKKFLNHVGRNGRVARDTHRLLTLPWDDDGSRILSTQGHAHYTEQMRLRRHAFEASVIEFKNQYPNYINEAKLRLGTMFNDDDYPAVAEISDKFGIDVEIKPIPDATDFRAKLTDNSVKAIVKDIEQRTQVRLQKAMNEVFERIVDATGKMVEGLRTYAPAAEEGRARHVFRDSLIYNIKELADLLPSLNITDDKRLNNLQQELASKLVEHSPEVLRVNDKLRNKTADEAERIFKKVKGFIA